jgi:hypothetical protein
MNAQSCSVTDAATAEDLAHSIRLFGLKDSPVDTQATAVGCLGYDDIAARLVGMRPMTADGGRAMRAAIDATQRALSAAQANVPPAAEIRALLERLNINGYGVNGPGGVYVAAACFAANLHLANHSCRPNLVFDSASPVEAADTSRPPMFALLALHDIPAGAELTISYLGLSATALAEPTDERRAHLHEMYGFTCRCDRCEGRGGDEAEAAWQLFARARRCPREGVCGSGLGVPTQTAEGTRLRCVHCAGEWDVDECWSA